MLDVSAGNAALKIRYAKGMSRILYENKKLTPFVSRIKAKRGMLVSGAFGQKFVVPIKWNDPQTATADFSTGYTKSGTSNGNSRYSAFEVPAVLGYAHARVSGPAIAQSEDKTSAFVDLGAEELDGQLRSLHRKIAVTGFGNGFGKRGKIATVGNPFITLTNKEDIIRFEVDQDVVAAAVETTGNIKANGSFRITGKDPSTGKLTFATDPSAGGTPWAVNDLLFIAGERDNTATKLNWFGVGGWIPDAMPAVGGGDSWCNVDRSADPRLAGHRYDSSGDGNVRDALIKASAYGFNNGITTTACYMNPADFARLCVQLEGTGSKQYNMTGQNAKISFKAIDVGGLSGDFPCIPEPTVDKGKAYMLNEDSWYAVYSGDDLVHVGQDDGMVYRNVAGADTFAAYARTISNLVCDSPGENMVVLALP
jgi:hypothetical protein